MSLLSSTTSIELTFFIAGFPVFSKRLILKNRLQHNLDHKQVVGQA